MACFCFFNFYYLGIRLDGEEAPPDKMPPEDNVVQQEIADDPNKALSFRAIVTGILIGVAVAAMNVNFGLRTGWTQGGTIFAAILSISVFKIIRPLRVFTKSEACICTTTASAVGTMASAAGLIACIPALKLLGHTYSVWELFLWGMSVAYFGVYFAVPMRRQLIEVEELRYPSGTATAETIKAMFVEGQETIKKAKVLSITAFLSGIYVLIVFFFPFIQQPPLPAILMKYGFILYFNPMLIGGGMLSGARACTSLLAGSIVGWGILAPIVEYYRWSPGPVMEFDGARGWILWVGVSVMTIDSLMTLVFSIPMMFQGALAIIRRIIMVFRKTRDIQVDDSREGDVPFWWWSIGLLLSTILLTLVGQFYFSIQFYFVWLAIPLSALLSLIAARCSGETDINPVGGMGKVTQLVFAGVAPRQITTNLLSAGIVAAGASQCGDMMQDLKVGYLLKVHANKQFIAQCIGIFFGILVCIPIYKLFDSAYKIGGEQIPAPAAQAWKSVAVILSQGLGSLPTHSPWGMLAGGILAVILSITYRFVGWVNKGYAQYIPSALAFGIGFIVPPKQAITMFMGALGLSFWNILQPEVAESYYFAISSGLVSGEGLMAVVIAIMRLIGLRPVVAA